jgi:hypothetical protein
MATVFVWKNGEWVEWMRCDIKDWLVVLDLVEFSFPCEYLAW